MLSNASGFDKIYIACGRTDLRKGIDGLCTIIQHQLEIDPFQKNVLFMFCGSKPGLGRRWISSSLQAVAGWPLPVAQIATGSTGNESGTI